MVEQEKPRYPAKGVGVSAAVAVFSVTLMLHGVVEDTNIAREARSYADSLYPDLTAEQISQTEQDVIRDPHSPEILRVLGEARGRDRLYNAKIDELGHNSNMWEVVIGLYGMFAGILAGLTINQLHGKARREFARLQR